MRRALVAAIAAALIVPAAAAPPTVRDAWVRAMPPGVPNSAAYLEIVNAAGPDRLLGATTDAAERVEIHTRVDTDGMVGMRRLDGLAVPAEATVTLAPGGTHLMLMGLTGPLTAGETIALTLRFERAGEIELAVPVRDPRPER